VHNNNNNQKQAETHTQSHPDRNIKCFESHKTKETQTQKYCDSKRSLSGNKMKNVDRNICNIHMKQ